MVKEIDSKYKLPVKFVERAQKVFLPHKFDQYAGYFSSRKNAAIRVNTLKYSVERAQDDFNRQQIAFRHISTMGEAFILNDEILKTDFVQQRIKEGCLYQQGLASMYVTHILDPKENERVLDMCAAPGSKSGHIAAQMNNTGELVCLERVKSRFYKLKSVLKLMGVENGTPYCLDARRFDAKGVLFDRILIDAPCSSEGRFKSGVEKTYKFWSTRKIKEMRKKQKGLIRHAARFLKNEGVLVYSTCTFSPEENEEVIDWFLKKENGRFIVEKIDKGVFETYDCLISWGKRVYDSQLANCLRIAPNEFTDGFFMAKLRKVG